MLSGLKNAIGRAGIYLVDDVRLFVYFLWFAGLVIVFGMLYTALTPIGHGIGSNLKAIGEDTRDTGMVRDAKGAAPHA